ncbi:hypothetical protein [Sphingobium agri]|uniref:Uncharacterized protein n=1 Tax=Sphingobium agri TaxID=2933566 RepID=A0ABT0DUA6_9SPHN|nr:hypothetical protein [Sphingobium agri]MCK0530685.1 hypothetical protein [Sphingobium agri]
MEEWLFMLLGEAVAQQATGFRPGARHAIMVFLTAPDQDTARRRAKDVLNKCHWSEGAVTRIKHLLDPDLIEDDILRSAAETALLQGDAIVVYKDELRHDG